MPRDLDVECLGETGFRDCPEQFGVKVVGNAPRATLGRSADRREQRMRGSGRANSAERVHNGGLGLGQGNVGLAQEMIETHLEDVHGCLSRQRRVIAQFAHA